MPLFQCETPKSPPGDYNHPRPVLGARRYIVAGVKHLNPRQGITTRAVNACQTQRLCWGVKHLNPRQGITTDSLYNL